MPSAKISYNNWMGGYIHQRLLSKQSSAAVLDVLVSWPVFIQFFKYRFLSLLVPLSSINSLHLSTCFIMFISKLYRNLQKLKMHYGGCSMVEPSSLSRKVFGVPPQAPSSRCWVWIKWWLAWKHGCSFRLSILNTVYQPFCWEQLHLMIKFLCFLL